MEFYHVTLRVNDTAPLPAEDNCAMLRMELLITIGDNARQMVPGHPHRSQPVTVGDIIKGTLHDLRLSGLMHISALDKITPEEAEQYAG